jgi:hypothetical protein
MAVYTSMSRRAPSQRGPPSLGSGNPPTPPTERSQNRGTTVASREGSTSVSASMRTTRSSVIRARPKFSALALPGVGQWRTDPSRWVQAARAARATAAVASDEALSTM